ncbi:MAG: hypothetical protein ACREUT_22395 [Steroidobacteraceae bacterium]
MATDPDEERRKRVRRTTAILALIAIAFYASYIVMSMIDASRAAHRHGAPPTPASAPR